MRSIKMPPCQSSCPLPVDEISAETGDNDLHPLKTNSTVNITDGTVAKEEPNSATNSPACPRVSFADVHQVHFVLGLEEYTSLEHKCTWPSPYEIYQSKFHMDQLITRLLRGKPCTKDMTYRGLEAWTPSGAERLREMTSEVKRVVMEEQNRQRELELCDPEVLATRSASISVACQQRALERAEADAHEVQLYSASDDAKSKRMLHGAKKRWSLLVFKERS